MKISDLTYEHFSHKCKYEGIKIELAQSVISLHSQYPDLLESVFSLYSDYSVSEAIADFKVELTPPLSIRRYIKKQVCFKCNSKEPFMPLPRAQAFPLLEWGLNWTATNHINTHLLIHSAVLEKSGNVLIMPGTPGSGKSTLCAALTYRRGYNLFSDELAFVGAEGDLVYPNARPVSLKNRSIDIIKEFAPDIVHSNVIHDTIKGSVAHFKPPANSVKNIKPARPKAIIFPKYQADLPTKQLKLMQKEKADTLLELSKHCFNFSVLHYHGFEILGKLINNSNCYSLEYGGDLATALKAIDEIME